MLTKTDLNQIENYGLSLKNLVGQIETFRRGIPYTKVITAASVGNGIEQISENKRQQYVNLYESKKDELEVVKFVPASGAATRMFKFLHAFLEHYDSEEEGLTRYIKNGNHTDLATFFASIKEFAFINSLRKKIRETHSNFKQSTKGQRSYLLAQTLLNEDGLNFSKLPKGLIPFHKYTKYATTPFEEQMYEAAHYAKVNGEVFLHFTFSENHLPYFKKEFEAIKKRVGKKTKTKFNISYSFQKKETNTIAVNEKNEPFRNADGKLVFRPAGHGALIDNLNDVSADVVFIKNIDNVVAEEYVENIAHYKKVLAGKLLWLQQRVFGYLEKLHQVEATDDILREVKSFMWNELNIKEIPDDKSFLIDVLDRPIRVCGVVKNTGEPGGGPFWVSNGEGRTSLQIVEMSQIDVENSHQAGIVSEATHFNPVDLVCGFRNFRGEKFDLSKYVDANSGFISSKSENGKPIKALELPGLWNGAMAHWNTIFVEVPPSTFNPVKTVNDLLKKEHRPNA